MPKSQNFESLEEAILSYLTMDGTKKAIAAAKGKVTRIVNTLAIDMPGREFRQKVLDILEKQTPLSTSFQMRLEVLKERFTYKSFYVDGIAVFGWWSEEQHQAERLPLDRLTKSYEVSFGGWTSEQIYEWKKLGFDTAQCLPVKFYYERQLEVEFDVKASLFWQKHGYALPCRLQYHRAYEDPQETALHVDRSIISAGFWCAYKWWEGCKWWYMERHPEWFSDDEMWPFEKPPSPPDNLQAAVIGGTNKDYWESVKFKI